MIADNATKDKERIIIECANRFREKEEDDEFIRFCLDKIKARADKNAVENADEIIKSRINELEGNCMKQQILLRHCVPSHTIFYLIINTSLITASFLLLFLRFVYGIYTIDPYYLICGFGIGMTLFLTAFISLRDWKKFISGDTDR